MLDCEPIFPNVLICSEGLTMGQGRLWEALVEACFARNTGYILKMLHSSQHGSQGHDTDRKGFALSLCRLYRVLRSYLVVLMLLPKQASTMKKNVGHERVIWPKCPFNQTHAACQALHSMGPIHAALLRQLYCTLHLHTPQVTQKNFPCTLLGSNQQPLCLFMLDLH